MDLTERLRAWTHQRQRLGEAASSPADALRSVAAVYSAHPTAPLALAARAGGMSADDFRELDRRRAALRVPGMRGTLFLAPVETAARIFAPFAISRAQLASRLRRGGMSDAEYTRVADRIVAAAVEPLLPGELKDVAGVKGIEMSILLRTMRAEGRLLAVSDGSLRVAALRYVATASWAPGRLDVAEPGRALTELAGDYLHGYGPARVADFAWWTGLAKGTAAKALAAHDTIDVGGGLLLPRADEAAFTRLRRLSGTVDLLPKWDPYTMGHAPDGRARLVDPANQAAIYVQKGIVAPGQPNVGLSGDGYPVVLVDGEAMGTWNLTLKGATVALFGVIGAAAHRRLDERLAQMGSLLAG